MGDPRLSVARLTLTDFRCYGFLRLETGPRPVVITGPNGAGKTNLLEALSFLVPGRGLRRVRLSEPGRREEPDAPPRPWAVAARLVTPAGPVEVGTGVDSATTPGREKRVVHVDGRPARGQAVLAEHAGAQWLTPQMDRLFLEAPSGRRRFLDRLVFGFDPAHAGRVSAYERALRERAHLLRQGRADPAWLNALEDVMATRGVAVAAARREVVARLGEVCAVDAGPFPGAHLRVEGMVEDWLAEGPALDAEDRLRAALAASRPADAVSGGAVNGPHRSDLRVRHLAKGQAAELCSTGEQKALLIAIVLANARLHGRERDAVPLLLLDEVAAHLDRIRREALFEEILRLGAQAWLTGTDASLFEPLAGHAQFLRVDGGMVT